MAARGMTPSSVHSAWANSSCRPTRTIRKGSTPERVPRQAGHEEHRQDQPVGDGDAGRAGAEELVQGELDVEHGRQQVEEGRQEGVVRQEQLLLGKDQEEVQEEGRQQVTYQSAAVLEQDVVPEVAVPVQVGHEEDREHHAEQEEEPGRFLVLALEVDEEAYGQVDQRQGNVDIVFSAGDPGRRQLDGDLVFRAVPVDQVDDLGVRLLAAQDPGGVPVGVDDLAVDAGNLVPALQGGLWSLLTEGHV